MTLSSSSRSASRTARGLAFLTASGVVAVLYFAREFFLPLALAILISFLLAPVIRRLERWHLGRIAAVIFTSALTFLVLGCLTYLIAGQLIDLANTLPQYKSNLHAKVVALKTTKDGPLNRATNTLRELSAELTDDPLAAAAGTTAAPGVPHAPPGKEPLPVAVIKNPGSALGTLRDFVAPIAAPLGTATVVIVLVIFILLEREDLRDRIIHLVGRGKLHVTTQAVDEAGARVSRYLGAQFVVNVTYGIPIGVGLGLIGIPNAVLWGVLATILRFIPYIGAWIAAAFPLLLSLAIAPNWTAPVLALSLFIVIELISNNVVEPWLYGASTGLSPMAIIVSALFWAWLWGGIGLLLATPLTVCLAVLGKYIPALTFLDVLLGDRPPIATSERFYQRLLALDAEEVVAICEEYTAEHALAATFDEVIVPALRMVDGDHRAGEFDEVAKKEIHRTVREVIIDLGEQELAKVSPCAATPTTLPLCLPASCESDELCALMLLQLLALGGLPAETLSAKALAGEMVERAATLAPKHLCLSVVVPSSILPAQHLCRRLRERLGTETRLLIGLWGEPPAELLRRQERFKRVSADEVFTKLGEAARELLLQAGCTPAAAAAIVEK